MIVRASEHPEGATLSVHGPSKYHRARVLGVVMLDPEGRHALYGGECEDGAREVSVEAGALIVDEPEREPGDYGPPTWAPDPEPEDIDLSDIAADRYERGLDAIAARRWG